MRWRFGVYSGEPFSGTHSLEFSLKKKRVGLRHCVLQTTWQESRPVVSYVFVAKSIETEAIIEDIDATAATGSRFSVIENNTGEVGIRRGKREATARICAAEITVQIEETAFFRISAIGAVSGKLQIECRSDFALKTRGSN
jgi:hypothetical protein